MDQRECPLQPFGICYKLYHFITKTLASQALKTVTLGRPTPYTSSSTAARDCSSKADKVVRLEDDDGKELQPTQCLIGDSTSSPAQQGEGKNEPCMEGDEMVGEDVTPQEAKPPKKMVSINENVEEILPSKKKKKRSKSFQKSRSRGQEEEEEEEPKPGRSILRVSSDLNDKSN